MVDPRLLPPLPEAAGDEAVASVAIAAAQEAAEEVVTGAAKREQSLGNVASAVTVLSADRLRRFGYRTVSEALASTAGLYVVDDRMTHRVGIRGLQLLGDFNTRTLSLVDGHTLNEPFNQFVGIEYDLPVVLDDVARIEVIRGPVSSVYGTNAFFGIINLITRSADQSPTSYGRLGASSFGGIAGTAGFAAGEVDRQVRGHLALLGQRGETVSYPAFVDSGYDAGTSADGLSAFSGSVVARYKGIFAQLRGYQRERELAGAPYETVPGDQRNANTDGHFLGEVGITHDVTDRLSVTARGYANRYTFRDFLVYEYGEPDDDDFEDVIESKWAGAEVRASLDAIPKKLYLTAGVEGSHNIVDSSSFYSSAPEDSTDVSKTFDQVGAYGEAFASLAPWLAASVGARTDHHTEFGGNVSPRAALFVSRPERYGLKLLFAQGFRYPSTYEAFFEDGIDFIGNPSLSPERITSYEAVAWLRLRAGFHLRLSGFRWDATDLIGQEVVDVEGGESRLQFQNLSELSTTGAEAEGSFRTTDGWLAFGSFSYARVHEGDASRQAANAPRVQAAGGASTPLYWKLLHFSTEAQYVGGRNTREPGLRADRFLRWNATLYFPSLRGIDATVGVRNLLGTREQVPAQEDYDREEASIYLIPGAGREFYGRLGYAF